VLACRLLPSFRFILIRQEEVKNNIYDIAAVGIKLWHSERLRSISLSWRSSRCSCWTKSALYKKCISIAGEYAIGGMFLISSSPHSARCLLKPSPDFCRACCAVAADISFPQILLFAVALVKQDKNVADYSIAFSICGAAVASISIICSSEARRSCHATPRVRARYGRFLNSVT